MEFSTRSIDFEKCVIKSQIWDTAGFILQPIIIDELFKKVKKGLQRCLELIIKMLLGRY